MSLSIQNSFKVKHFLPKYKIYAQLAALCEQNNQKNK